VQDALNPYAGDGTQVLRSLQLPLAPKSSSREAKELVETGKTSAEVGLLLDIKPGTIREWKRRYMWDGPARRI
jgi:hypothetical protein